MRMSQALAPAAVLCGFVIYLSNVMIGAAGGSVFLSDVGEMLMLFATCVCFVIFILQRERSALSDQQIKQ